MGNRRKRLSDEEWELAREKYEDVESSYSAKSLAKELDVTVQSVNYHIKKEGWISPKIVKRDAKKLVEARMKQRAQEAVESLADRYEALRENNFELARKALEDFAKQRPVPDSFREALHARDLAREAAGIVEDTGLKIGINLSALSVRDIEDAEVVDV